MRRLLRGRQSRRKFVVAVVPRDFFDQIDAARDVVTPGGLPALPRGGERAIAAAICVDAHGMKPQRAENFFDVAIGNVRAHHAQKFFARELDLPRLVRARDRRPQLRQEFRRQPIAESVPRRAARQAPPSRGRRRVRSGKTLRCASRAPSTCVESRWDRTRRTRSEYCGVLKPISLSAPPITPAIPTARGCVRRSRTYLSSACARRHRACGFFLPAARAARRCGARSVYRDRMRAAAWPSSNIT